MKLQFLGTAAAEGIPAIFCTCEVCRRARALGGKNIRTRSQSIVNDALLIDFPCETYSHMNQNGLHLSEIRHLLITHVHRDHFYPSELENLSPSFATLPKNFPKLHVYGSADVAEKLSDLTEAARARMEIHTVAPYAPFEATGLTVTALRANHGTENPYIYLIEDGDKSILYAHDTGYFTDETWEYLVARGKPIDLVSFDCTGGAAEDLSYAHHMCLGRAEVCRARMREVGMLTDRSVCVLNHFSHNGVSPNYDELTAIAEPRGFLTSYDTMSVTI